MGTLNSRFGNKIGPTDIYYIPGNNYVTKVWELSASFGAEIDILCRLRSKYLVSGANLSSKPVLHLQMEFLSGDFSTLTSQELPVIRALLLDVAKGLNVLHQCRYLHLAVNLNSCFWTGSSAKLGGFGSAIGIELDAKMKAVPYITKQLYMSGLYRPPEIDSSTIYHQWTDKSDIWALGMVFLQVLTRNSTSLDLTSGSIRDHFDPSRAKANLTTWLQPYVPSAELKSAVTLLQAMLNLDPTIRCTSTQVVEAKFLQNTEVLLPVGVSPVSTKTCRPSYFQFGGLRFLIETADQVYPHKHVELLFIAIDIYMRCSSKIEANFQLLKRIAVISIELAYSLFEHIQVTASEWKLTCRVLSTVDGILRRPYLYDHTSYLEQLVMAFRDLFLNTPETLSSYLTLSLSGYLSLQPYTTSRSKVTTIAKFLKLVRTPT